MKSLILISTILFAFSAFAKQLTLSDWQNATVKVNSHSRLWGSPYYSGTGILVWSGNHAWVLTSEHVLLNPDTYDSVVELLTVKGNKTADVKVADYLKGMAVLESWHQELKDIAIPLEDFSAAAGVSPASMTALGFPVASNALQTLNGGELRNAQSPRALIPGLRTFLEVDRLPVEYGMSGGALLNSATGDHLTYSGMISHQYLKRSQGRPTQVRNLDTNESASAQDLLLAIPASEAVAFLNSAIASDRNVRTWKHFGYGNEETLVYGPLTFTVREEGTQDVWKISGRDNGAIGGRGGGDGGGIGGKRGGGDGGGIGGDGADSSKFQSVRVEVTYAKDTDGLPQEMQKWLSWLKAGRQVRILYTRPKSGGRLTRITSLDRFLTAWLREGEEPVAIQLGAMSSREEDVPAAARQIGKAVRNASAHAQGEARLSWLASLRELAVQAEAGMIGSREIKAALTGPYAATWDSYYNESFDDAVAVEGAMEALAEKMRALGL